VELETLLERCKAGDELAWEALVRRFQGRVFALAYHYLRNREEAQDVAQETFIRIYRSLEGFDDHEKFLPWLVRIARNCSIDRIRRLKVRPPLGGDELDEQTVGPHPGTGPETIAMAGERSQLVYQALDQMTEINREMILLKEIQGLKQREIADLLDIPLGTVKARSNRARVELARRIVELDPSYGAGA
jgi:RNA polymerase sigma-70 factor (ECF subfamily)